MSIKCSLGLDPFRRSSVECAECPPAACASVVVVQLSRRLPCDGRGAATRKSCFSVEGGFVMSLKEGRTERKGWVEAVNWGVSVEKRGTDRPTFMLESFNSYIAHLQFVNNRCKAFLS